MIRNHFKLGKRKTRSGFRKFSKEPDRREVTWSEIARVRLSIIKPHLLYYKIFSFKHYFKISLERCGRTANNQKIYTYAGQNFDYLVPGDDDNPVFRPIHEIKERAIKISDSEKI